MPAVADVRVATQRIDRIVRSALSCHCGPAAPPASTANVITRATPRTIKANHSHISEPDHPSRSCSSARDGVAVTVAVAVSVSVDVGGGGCVGGIGVGVVGVGVGMGVDVWRDTEAATSRP
jgi:hypothetical protein